MKIKDFKQFLNEYEIEGNIQKLKNLNPKVTITFKIKLTFWDYDNHEVVDPSMVKYSKKYDKPSMWIKNWGDDSDGAITLIDIMIRDVAEINGLNTSHITNASTPKFVGDSIVFRPDFNMWNGNFNSEGNFSSIEEWEEKVMELAEKASKFVNDEVFNIGDSMGYEEEYFSYKDSKEKCIQIDNVAIAIDNIKIGN